MDGEEKKSSNSPLKKTSRLINKILDDYTLGN